MKVVVQEVPILRSILNGADRRSRKPRLPAAIESLESRTLLSESATGQLSLVSTTGTASNPVFHYAVTVMDTGTTNIGTFWFGWVPGEDLLPSAPSAVTNPSGWTSSLTGSGNSFDGSAIQWVASSNSITPGQSLSGFGFTSTDSPAKLAGNSPTHPGTPVLTSFVYSGAPFSDAGVQFQVAPAAATTTAASTTTLHSSATSAQAGTPITFTVVVAPASGTGAMPTGTVNFTRDGNPLGSAALQPDGTATLTTSALPAGTDNITASYAGDGNYSASASSPVVETISPATPGTSTPALAPTITGSTLPQALVAGAPDRGIVKVGVTNSTGTDVKGRSAVAVFATKSGSIDSSAVLLGQLARSMTIKAGRSVATSVPIRLGAGTLPAGAYTLVARVTDPSGNTSDSPAAQTLNVAAPFIALSEVSVKSTVPSSAASGARLHAAVTFTVTNSGNVSTSGNSTIDLFATSSGTIDNAAVQLASAVARLRIKPGKSARISVRVTSLPAVAAGTYTIIGQVTDSNGQTSSALVGSLTIA